MTTKLRWFKFYPGDWALDTQGMTPLAKGLYVDMLCMQWAGRRLPADLAELSIMLPAMTERTYRELLQHFVDEDGWLVNGRLERERDDAEGRSENGRAAARAKHESDSARSAAAVPPHSGRIAGAVPPQCHQEADTEAEAEQEEEEEEKRVPRKARKRAADPLVWTDDGWQGITDKDRAQWAEAFPDVDFDRDLAKANLWVISEGARKKNWRAFLMRWFAKTQADGGNKQQATGPISASPRRLMRDESHIPENCHPDDRHRFFDGNFPTYPSLYHDHDGNLRSGQTGRIICEAKSSRQPPQSDVA